MVLAPVGARAASPAEETEGRPASPTAGIVDIAASIPQRALMVDRDGVAWTLVPAAETFGLDKEEIQGPRVPKPVPIPTRVTQVAQASPDGTWLALDEAGAVWAWDFGARRGSPTPAPIPGLPPIAQVYSGHPLVLDVNGVAWTWTDTAASSIRPRKVRLAKPIEAIWASESFAYARLIDGSVWAWGTMPLDGRGRTVGLGFGDGTTTREHHLPVRIRALDGVRAMAFTFGKRAFNRVSFAVMPGGRVVGWGDNQRGLLGRDPATRFVRRPVTVPGLARIQSIATDGQAAIAVDDRGRAFTWGRFYTNAAVWRPISARPEVVPGVDGIAEVTLLSTVHMWGCDGNTGVGGNALLARLTDGRLLVWGYAEGDAAPSPVQTLTMSPQPIVVGPVAKVIQTQTVCMRARGGGNTATTLYVVLQDGTVQVAVDVGGDLIRVPLWN